MDFFGKPTTLPSTKEIVYTPTKRKEVTRWQRKIDQSPKEALDAPNIMNNFYLDILAWGSKNVLAVALYDSIYLRDMKSKVVQELPGHSGSDSVSCVSFNGETTYLAASYLDRRLKLYDVDQAKVAWTSTLQSSMISSSWNGIVLTLGGQDGVVSLKKTKKAATFVKLIKLNKCRRCFFFLFFIT
jgi:WD40 repeat protein